MLPQFSNRKPACGRHAISPATALGRGCRFIHRPYGFCPRKIHSGRSPRRTNRGQAELRISEIGTGLRDAERCDIHWPPQIRKRCRYPAGRVASAASSAIAYLRKRARSRKEQHHERDRSSIAERPAAWSKVAGRVSGGAGAISVPGNVLTLVRRFHASHRRGFFLWLTRGGHV